MRFYDVSFFCDEEDVPQVHVENDHESKWPILLTINSSTTKPEKPGVRLWMSVKQFQLFAESVRSADQKLHEELMSQYDRAHTCTVCRKNFVDSDAGQDTCDECLRRV